ncbi:hypothetical protein [Actinacidiphila acidipaludis]|uniref:Uncharacterized protein n=1 Tax=Actinacidiphila acidipaludis TaxID=2873382 RepID=A0ABS7QBN9_9ACTN|nr:hypothetical protein [Streptomyces acidipaludis]MBY8880569.1 hypothetical protein [Streptomyces acidipaludis]
MPSRVPPPGPHPRPGPPPSSGDVVERTGQAVDDHPVRSLGGWDRPVPSRAPAGTLCW